MVGDVDGRFICCVRSYHTTLLTRSTDVLVACDAPSEELIPFEQFVDNLSALGESTRHTGEEAKSGGRLNVPNAQRHLYWPLGDHG